MSASRSPQQEEVLLEASFSWSSKDHPSAPPVSISPPIFKLDRNEEQNELLLKIKAEIYKECGNTAIEHPKHKGYYWATKAIRIFIPKFKEEVKARAQTPKGEKRKTLESQRWWTDTFKAENAQAWDPVVIERFGSTHDYINEIGLVRILALFPEIGEYHMLIMRGQ